MYLKKSGVDIRSRSLVNKKHSLDESVFDNLTPESVYWLGVLYGDGNISSLEKRKGYNIGLCGHSDDLSHGESFRSFLKGQTYPIRLRTDKKAYQIVVSSKRLYTRLTQLGLYPNKSNTIPFPTWIADDLLPHFVRGLFDTDGCIHVRNRKRYITKQGTFSIVMNTDFIKFLAESVCRILKMTPRTRHHSPTNHKSSCWSVEGLSQLKTLYKWLYTEKHLAPGFLARKHDKFSELVN